MKGNKMAIPEGMMQFSVVLEEKYGEMIKRYAEEFGISDARFIRNVVELAMEDHEWIFKAMTSSVGKKIRAVWGHDHDPERQKALEKKSRTSRSVGGLPEPA